MLKDDQIENLRRGVTATPEDLRLRYELGAALCERGDYEAAIEQLQKAVGAPDIQEQALKLLSEAFRGAGLDELAIDDQKA